MTNGVKKALNNNKNNYLDKFWDLNKMQKVQNQDNKVRTQEQMIEIAKNILDYELVKEDYKYYDYIYSYACGQVEYNRYGRKLYVKLNVVKYIPQIKQLGDFVETEIKELKVE